MARHLQASPTDLIKDIAASGYVLTQEGHQALLGVGSRTDINFTGRVDAACVVGVWERNGAPTHTIACWDSAQGKWEAVPAASQPAAAPQPQQPQQVVAAAAAPAAPQPQPAPAAAQAAAKQPQYIGLTPELLQQLLDGNRAAAEAAAQAAGAAAGAYQTAASAAQQAAAAAAAAQGADGRYAALRAELDALKASQAAKAAKPSPEKEEGVFDALCASMREHPIAWGAGACALGAGVVIAVNHFTAKK